MKNSQYILVLSLLFLVLVTGCASQRTNVAYVPASGGVDRLITPVNGVLLPVEDVREQARIYPKQIIVQKSYSGSVTNDINDMDVSDVFADAYKTEIAGIGVRLLTDTGITTPLDRETAVKLGAKLRKDYPDVRAAFGVKVTDFVAESERTLVTTNVHIHAGVQFYVLDVRTGELVWSDYRTDWDNTVASAGREYMIDQLNQALTNLMQKSVRENSSLRDSLVKASNRK